MPRLLGLDYGRKRIGVAVSDDLGLTAKALGHVPRSDDTSAARIVAALAKREDVAAIVIGLPLHAHGAAGENVRWVRRFCAVLKTVCTLPIHEVDERYSSGEAEDLLRERGAWPPKHPGDIDAESAAVVLRRYLAGES